MKKTRSLTYGAMILGIILMVILIDRSTLGFFGAALALPITLPLIIYGTKFEFKDMIVVYFSLIISTFLFSGLIQTIIMVTGYGAVALAFIYCYNHSITGFIKHFIMLFIMSTLYYLMIQFFGQYFGIVVNEEIELIAGFLKGVNYNLIRFTAYLSIFFTMLMEYILINISSNILISRLSRK